MAIIIDEIAIQVEVTGETSSGSNPASATNEDKLSIVNECVERVLEILKQKTER